MSGYGRGILLPSESWDRQTQQAQRTNQHGLGMLQGILQMQNNMRQAQMQDAQHAMTLEDRGRMNELRATIGNAPELANNPILRAAAQHNPNAVLPFLMPKPRDDKPISGAGGFLLPDQNAPNGYRFMPTAEPKAPTESDLSKLIRERNSLPPGDPNRVIYDQKINKLTTREPGININLTPPQAGVDANGNPVFFQTPKAGGAPTIVPGVRPPAKDADGLAAETAAKVAMQQQGIDGIQKFRGLAFNKDGVLKRGFLAAVGTPGVAGMPGNEDARIGYTAIRNAVEAKLRIETGANAPEPEVDRLLKRFLPTPFDSKGSAEYKLDELEGFFKSSLSQTKGVRQNPARRASDAPGAVIRFDAQGNKIP